MANLNMNAQEGRVTQATDVPTPKNLGLKVERPIETQKVAQGTFGDASGALDMAKAQAHAAEKVGTMIQDTIGRITNLQLAEEETRKRLYEQDWHTAEQESRTYAKEQSLELGLDTETQHQLYVDERNKRTDEVKGKYSFVTKIGNDVDQLQKLWGDRADADYMERVVVPARVDAVKSGHVKFLQNLNTAVSQAIASNPANAAQTINDARNQVIEYLGSPQSVAVWGSTGAMELGKKYVSDIQKDALAALAISNPEGTVVLLRNQTGDPATDPLHELDSTLRREMLYVAEREVSARRSEQERAVKARQDQREGDLSLDVVTGKLRGTQAVKQVYDEWKSGAIDQQHYEKLIVKIQSEADRRERRAQAAAERHEKKLEKETALLEPAESAMAYMTQLDPKNAQHRKSVDAYAKKWLDQMREAAAKNGAGLLPKDVIDVYTQITNRTGIAPTPMIRELNTLLFSDDPKKVVEGAKLVTQIKENAPRLVHSLSDEAASIWSQVNNGVTPKQAHVNMERGRGLTKEQKDEYERRAKDVEYKLPKMLKDEFGISDKEIPPEAIGHAKEIFRQQLHIANGDAEVALEASKTLIKKNYGVSTLTGKKTVMWNPPEAGDDTPQWMIDDLSDTLKPYGLKREQVRLQSRGDGIYHIFIVDEKTGRVTGRLADQDHLDQPVLWYPDPVAAANKEKAKAVEKLKIEREKYLKSGPSLGSTLMNPPAMPSPFSTEKPINKNGPLAKAGSFYAGDK